MRSRFQQQDKISSQAIGKFSTDFIPDTVVTAATTSTFRYELIDALAESQDYMILLMKKSYVQPLDKRTLTGGTVEEFKRFLEEKTGKTFRCEMNEFSITPFRGLHLLLLLLTAMAALLLFLLLRGKPEARRSRFLIGVCFFNLALFAGYKLSLSMDAAYVRAYYPNGFNIFNELPLHLCNINLFLIPLGMWKRNRSIMGFSFFVAPLGALMALLFPEPLFSGFSLFLPRIFGYYVTHAILVVCGLSLATLGFYRPDPRDIPRILKTFGLLAVGAHLINLLLHLTLCPEANYFFTYGAEISVLKLFWCIIPAPLLYGLPAPLILAAYMYAVCALSRLTQRAEEVSFS